MKGYVVVFIERIMSNLLQVHMFHFIAVDGGLRFIAHYDGVNNTQPLLYVC